MRAGRECVYVRMGQLDRIDMGSHGSGVAGKKRSNRGRAWGAAGLGFPRWAPVGICAQQAAAAVLWKGRNRLGNLEEAAKRQVGQGCREAIRPLRQALDLVVPQRQASAGATCHFAGCLWWRLAWPRHARGQPQLSLEGLRLASGRPQMSMKKRKTTITHMGSSVMCWK